MAALEGTLGWGDVLKIVVAIYVGLLGYSVVWYLLYSIANGTIIW